MLSVYFSVLINQHYSDGMFIILIPIALSPLIVTLLWSDRITKRTTLASAEQQKKPYTQCLLDIAEELDAVGLLLIGASISLTLVPLSFIGHTTRWGDGGEYTLVCFK